MTRIGLIRSCPARFVREGDEASNKLADFFQKSKDDPEHWNMISIQGLQRINECYTWKIYAKKVLNMANIYSFWRHLNKDEKEAKRRYIQAFYNLQFKKLAIVRRSQSRLGRYYDL
ncbi:hypothetical protein LIER_04794 [Lithospermum erythrorhizon]|uniref:sucrose synthase n=1 Tax=Lithospermum erythrorhizon TaxID=34254 RepID=A0AAV3NY10_LITER